MTGVFRENTSFLAGSDHAGIVDAGPGVVYVCGPCDPAEIAGGARAAGLAVTGNYHSDRWNLRVRRQGREGALAILPIARWTGTQDVEPLVARHLLSALGTALWKRFSQRLCPTPAETGFWCWHATAGYYPPLPEAVREAFTGTQGRFEVCPAVATIPALYCLDMRLAYAAAALQVQGSPEWRHEVRPRGGWSLPTADGEAGNAYGNYGFLGWTPARYRVEFRAPVGWSHVGLLPSLEAGTGRRCWPLLGECWADGSEVRLAIEHGWHVEVLERLHAVREESLNSWRNPLRQWATGLIDIREQPLVRPSQHDMWRTACRNVILHAIGLMAGSSRLETRTVDRRDGEWATWDDVPGDAIPGSEEERGEDIVYQGRERVGSAHFRHPELAHAVWGLTRSWLLSRTHRENGGTRKVGALHLPRERVVAFAQDAIYMTDVPSWPEFADKGYRVKAGVDWRDMGPNATMPAPRNRAELLQLMGEGGE